MSLKDIHPKEDIEALLKDVELTRKTYNPAGEWRHLKKNGELINVEIISHTITFNNRKARHVMVKDITRRKLAEANIIRLNRVYTVLSNINEAIVRTRDKQLLFNEVCRIAVEDGGFLMAWIGMVNTTTNKVDVVASAGKTGKYLNAI